MAPHVSCLTDWASMQHSSARSPFGFVSTAVCFLYSSAVRYYVYNMVISNSKVKWSTIKLLTLSALFFREIKIKNTCLGLCKILPLTLHDEWYNALLNNFNYCKQCLLVVHSAYCSTGLRVIEISSCMFCRPCMVKVISKRCTTPCLSVSPMH